MDRYLFAWIGLADLSAQADGRHGPILAALLDPALALDAAWLSASWETERISAYAAWLAERAPHVRIVTRPATLTHPNAFTDIYSHASTVVAEALAQTKKEPELFFHLSPGTPVMASVWLLLATSRFPADLLESSGAGKTNFVEKPFNLPAQILPDLLRDPDQRLRAAAAERPQAASTFGEIVYRSEVMERVTSLARKAAPRNVPLLIEGESGTGKELLAHAVRMASPRADKPMVIVNCGAIPANLVESRLFGHRRGSFTGAETDQKGCFEEADGGTLFLDEIGELPLPAQVALLRVLEAREITRIGENRTRKVDVRLIAATNRDLAVEMREKRFREDLFYRLAVLRIRLPALRERGDDVDLLIDRAMVRINQEMAEDPLYVPKTLSADAKRVLAARLWPGNVRELYNTMRRALVWSDHDMLSEDDVAMALLDDPAGFAGDPILERPLGPSCNLDAILAEVSAHYIRRALSAAGDNKSRAAKLIGFGSYQRLDAQRGKLGI
jgi:DNA-binding NtrC family response regulator